MVLDPIWISVGSWLVIGLISALLALLWWGIRTVVSTLREIQVDLHLVSGRTIKMESWAEAHDKQDDARHTEMREEISGLWRRG